MSIIKTVFRNYIHSHKTILLLAISIFMICQSHLSAQTDPDRPNILLIIADDLGVDYSNGYHEGQLMPTTPTLDSLRSVGITFENVFAAPMCTPSRASIMSGKYGIKTGVQGTPGNLNIEHTSIFKAIEEATDNAYADAVIGKWHISNPANPDHPEEHSIDYYAGFLSSGVEDYYAWNKTKFGSTTLETTYATTYFTEEANEWINNNEQPWFCWVAHAAPHGPYHTPPEHMYSIPTTGNTKRKYIAMIEALDYETNRMINSMDEDVRENTIIIYLGDNGTPNNVLQDYPNGHGKGTLYQGGVRIPMIIAGAKVSRKGERESALIHVADLYATILELAGGELPGGIYNSLSFDHLLSNEEGPTRPYNYTEFRDQGEESFAIRNAEYKLINFGDGTQEFYNLLADSFEINDLQLSGLTDEEETIRTILETEALQIRDNWSCQDSILNGDETEIDCGGSHCAPCFTATTEQDSKTTVSLYPNPTTDKIHLNSSDSKIKTVSIYRQTGLLIRRMESINASEYLLLLDGIPAQELIIEIMLEDKIERHRIMKL